MELAYHCVSYQENELFSETAKFWDLESLYVDLAQQKLNNKKRETQLTPIEKACLRGLLSGHSPRKIATALHWTSGAISVELTKGLYRYVETLTGRKQNVLKNWRDISQWLEAAGYKTPTQRQDWGEAPDIPVFYGRTGELNLLKQWIVQDQCRLVTLLGMGGIGKTALAAQLAKKIQGEFNFIIWRSLGHALSINQLLADLIQFLYNQQQCNLPEDTEVLISRFREFLRLHRCLVVLDDAESIMGCRTHAGQYRDGYERYGQLLRQVTQEQNQSCLVLISWEKPLQIELLEHQTSYIRSLKLSGLPKEEGRKILKVKGFSAEEKQGDELITIYRGNPLALNLVAQIIQDFFNGSVSQFLSWNSVIVPDPLRAILIEQLNRLDDLEKKVMCYLAINPTPVSFEKFRNGVQIDSASELINVLKSLDRRSIIEVEKIKQRNQIIFRLQP